MSVVPSCGVSRKTFQFKLSCTNMIYICHAMTQGQSKWDGDKVRESQGKEQRNHQGYDSVTIHNTFTVFRRCVCVRESERKEINMSPGVMLDVAHARQRSSSHNGSKIIFWSKSILPKNDLCIFQSYRQDLWTRFCKMGSLAQWSLKCHSV